MNGICEILTRLCTAPGSSGDEAEAARTAAEEFSKYAQVRTDAMGNMIAEMGAPDAKEHVLLDAHLDQIGMIVTDVDKNGFLRIDRCGGTDRRVLPGTPVTVYGKEPLCGIVCCTPPHLSDGDEDKVEPINKMAVDVGLSRKEAQHLVHPGDRLLFSSRPQKLLGDRFTAPGLDNRVSVASFIRCAQLLANDDLRCRVSILCSTREEVGGQGAVTGSFALNPTRAVVVDVSFATQPGLPPEKCGKLGGGAMIGFAPILSREISERLIKIAEEKKIPYKYDVMGNDTGTNADGIAVTRVGVPTGMISIPLRYMHTGAEIIDLRDAEYTAQLLAQYIREVS